MEKICPRCVNSKDLDDFNYKSSSRDRRQPYCRQCSKEDWHERYGKEERIIRNKVQREQVRQTISQFLHHKTCALCGADKNLILQPHSLVSSFVSRKYSALRIKALLQEHETTVLCSSCLPKTVEQMGNERDAPYSWTSTEYNTICLTCAETYLPETIDSHLQSRYRVDTTTQPNIPELFRGIWEANDNPEFALTTGYPPKCWYCGLYIITYKVLCLKKSKKYTDCGCPTCKPFLYKKQRW